MWWQEVTFKLALLGNNNDGIESRNGTASALLHIDESAGLGRLAKQKPKKKRRPESRQYQTGEIAFTSAPAADSVLASGGQSEVQAMIQQFPYLVQYLYTCLPYNFSASLWKEVSKNM